MERSTEDEMRTLLGRLLDPNIRFPPSPRLVPDLRTFAMPDGLGIQFRGGEVPIILRGERAGDALAFLLPRLDGTRTLDALLTECPPALPKPTLLRTLSLLHSKGLLTDAAPPPPGTAADDVLHRQMLFWGRHLDLSRNASSATEVQRRLATARLVLVGTGMFGIAAYDLLTRSGCTEVRAIDWNDDGLFRETLMESPMPPREMVHLPATSVDAAAAHLRAWAEETDFLVTATCDAPAALFRAINRISLIHSTPWLHGNMSGSRADIGPYVWPHDSACFHCMELRQASMQGLAIEEHLYQEHLAEERDAAERIPRGEAIWSATLAAGLLTGEVIRVVSGIAAPTLLNAVTEISPVSGVMRTNHFLRVPRCPECYQGEVLLQSVMDDDTGVRA
jgi:bacteriocin biosynthesis cyclodehydratase domain-containing protein